MGDQPKSGRKRQKQTVIFILVLFVAFVAITSVASVLINNNSGEEETTTEEQTTETTLSNDAETTDSDETETVTGENGENDTLYEAIIVEIQDSTTYLVLMNDTEYEVKLIGIEIASETEDVAVEYINTLFSAGDVVYLQYDESTTNLDGQQLCYLWLNNDIDVYNVVDCRTSMLQGLLLDNGYATMKEEYPNSRYESTFQYIVGIE